MKHTKSFEDYNLCWTKTDFYLCEYYADNINHQCINFKDIQKIIKDFTASEVKVLVAE